MTLRLLPLFFLLAACEPVLVGPTASGDGGKDPGLRIDGGAPPLTRDSGVDDSAAPPPPIADGGPPPIADGGAPPPPDGAPSVKREPGDGCTCDADCAGTSDNPGICVVGVCMNRGSRSCASAGSRDGECPTGTRCWNDTNNGMPICWPDCDTFRCAGACDGDGSCAPSATTSCDPACGAYCGGATDAGAPDSGSTACSPSNPSGICPSGQRCVDGACEATTSTCPSWVCTGANCTDIIQMPGSFDASSAQAIADGYYIATEPRYSFLRRDLTMLLRYAACEVAVRFPGGRPIGLSDLSQADGRTPGTDAGAPRHPTTTHTGSDMDLAYYQTDGANEPQIICGDGTDRNGNGSPGRYNDGSFCTTETNIIDWPREAYWFAKLSVTPLVRVFGIDQTLFDDFTRELGALHTSGVMSDAEFARASILGYGAAGGWQYHHHHSHMSYSYP